jgi:hypothetical protein
MIVNQLRTYEQDCTESDLYINGIQYCYVLEDVGRPHGVKINRETCIPEGHYKAVITRSTRFKKDMILLYNKEDMSVERFGVRFTGIRVHGGITIEHTAGCPLVGFKRAQGKVYNSASDELLKRVQTAIDAGESIDWIITEKI